MRATSTPRWAEAASLGKLVYEGLPEEIVGDKIQGAPEIRIALTDGFPGCPSAHQAAAEVWQGSL